ncbi:MAG: hypothetical protein QOK40_1453, partial [Miltoncostaeaceae bacterium]|nr:hypothetical protein [Miltoncostaeaceae bacterium]
MASSTGRSVRRPSKPDAAAQPTAAAAVADREALDAPAPAAALEQALDPVPEAPWVRGEEAPSVEDRPRPRVDA